MIAVVAVVVAMKLSGYDFTVYDTAPACAVQDTVACVFPAVATTFVGTGGTKNAALAL
jgi:hypothetical protein